MNKKLTREDWVAAGIMSVVLILCLALTLLFGHFIHKLGLLPPETYPF